MRLDMNEAELSMLSELLAAHARDLHPLIRRSRISSSTDDLKRELEDVGRLLEKVRSAATAETVN